VDLDLRGENRQKTHGGSQVDRDAREIMGCALAPSVERLHGGFFVQRSIMGKLARILAVSVLAIDPMISMIIPMQSRFPQFS